MAIAIIAILAAILFPVFLSAKRKALVGTCQAHQRSLCAALMMYTDDYGGWLPRIQFLSTGGGQLLCDKYVKNRQILACTAKMADPDDNTYGLPKVRNMGFAYNQHCLCDTVLTKSGVRNTDVYATQRDYGQWTGRPLASIRRTSRTPAFFCGESVHSVQSAYGTVYVGFGWEPEDARNAGRMWNAHGGGSDYCFLDGHVKWLPPGGNGFYQAIAGIDYDGNGTEGDNLILR